MQDADAIVWLKHVGPPHLRRPVLLVMGGMHNWTRLGAFASSLTIGGVSVVVRRRRRSFAKPA